jgi:hypothetical protein
MTGGSSLGSVLEGAGEEGVKALVLLLNTKAGAFLFMLKLRGLPAVAAGEATGVTGAGVGASAGEAVTASAGAATPSTSVGAGVAPFTGVAGAETGAKSEAAGLKLKVLALGLSLKLGMATSLSTRVGSLCVYCFKYLWGDRGQSKQMK